MKKEPLPKGSWWQIAKFWIALFIVMVVLLGVALGPICPPDCGSYARMSAALQTCHNIGLCLSQYAQDHNGHYPEGKSSTEVFQQLIDEKYVTDPSIFCLSGTGKRQPHSNKLKSENVSWDVTCCVDPSSPDRLPLVFLTGYKVVYQAGAGAKPLIQPPVRTWSQWWDGDPLWKNFITVCYKDTSARVIQPSDKDGSIPNFIPADFDPKGKTYRQLTP